MIDDLIRQTVKYKFIYALIGLIFGIFCIAGGAGLIITEVSGVSDITAKLFGFETTLTNAGPGLILAVVGVVIVFATKYSIKLTGKDKSGQEIILDAEEE